MMVMLLLLFMMVMNTLTPSPSALLIQQAVMDNRQVGVDFYVFVDILGVSFNDTILGTNPKFIVLLCFSGIAPDAVTDEI